MDQTGLYMEALKGSDVGHLVPTFRSAPTWYFDRFSTAWLFTNENLSVLDKVDYRGKDIVGIEGTGDHSIYSASHECGARVGIDKSLFACFFSELKESAMKMLDYKSFKDFFTYPYEEGWNFYPSFVSMPYSLGDGSGRSAGKYFSADTYDSLKGSLSEVPRDFFDSIIGKYSSYSMKREGDGLPMSSFFLKCDWGERAIRRVMYLRSKECYDHARSHVDSATRPVLYPMDVRKAAARIRSAGDMFDVAYLSNVPDCVADIGGTKDILGLFESVDGIVRPGGSVVWYGNRALDILIDKGAKLVKPGRGKSTPKSTTFNEAYLLKK